MTRVAVLLNAGVAIVLYSALNAHAIANNRNKFIADSSCNQADCLRCDLALSLCAKCRYVIIEESRECLRHCPEGHDPTWSTVHNVFGKTCSERSVLYLVSQTQVGIIAGASVLGAIGIGTFIGVLLLRRKGLKTSPPDSPSRGLPKSLQDKRPKTAEIIVRGKERAEFISRLRNLRNDAPSILRMMAATRNRFRSAGIGPDTPSDTKAKACRAVVRDLSRVLCLLSLKEEHLKTAPKDWDQLLSWTERLLVRYKRQEEMKIVGYNGEFDPPRSQPGRSLFVTRQQKAEQEKRRYGERAASNDQFNQVMGLRNEVQQSTNAWPTGKPMNIQGLEKSPKGLCHPIPSQMVEPYTNPPVQKDKKKKKKRREILNWNKYFWKRLTGRNTSENYEADVEKSLDHNLDTDLDYNSDDIPSQTFFDHIEAFAFEIQDEFEPINDPIDDNSAPILNIVSDKNSNHKINNNTLLTNNNNKTPNNCLNIYKNFKNNKLILDINTMNKLNLSLNEQTNTRISQKPKKVVGGKENRPSKLRRLSSTLLRKEKTNVVLTDENIKGRKRRPITRQKLVEKEKQKKIQDKYRKIKNLSAGRRKPEASPQLEPNQTNAPINQPIEGGDVYINIVKTPVEVSHTGISFYPSSEPSSITQNVKTYPRVEMNIKKVGVETNHTRTTILNKSRENKKPKTFYSRCEILTSV